MSLRAVGGLLLMSATSWSEFDHSDCIGHMFELYLLRSFEAGEAILSTWLQC